MQKTRYLPSGKNFVTIFLRLSSLKKSSANSSTIARSAGVIGIAVMCSRLLGLVREQVFAGMFGAGTAYDAFVVAFRIPNLLRDLFAEGALSAAFVTVFSDYNTNRSKEETWQLAANVLTFFAIALSIISLLGIWLAEPIVLLMAHEYSAVEGKIALTTGLTQIMMPFLIFISLAAVAMGILNSKGRFFIPAMASTFFNLGSIVGGVGLALILPEYGYPAITGMAVGTLIGGFLQLAIQLPSLKKIGFSFRPRLNISDPGLRRILKLMVPATVGLSAVQINIFINTKFASSCVEGSVSWLSYAFRLVQLPIGVFGVTFSIAMMPVLARHAAEKNIPEMRTTLVSSLVMVLALTVPATAGLILLSEPIVRLIFERYAFSAADTLATSQALALYAVGLFAYSSNKVLVPAFYALDKPKFPVIASFIAIGTNLIFINLTIDKYQHLAIALSTSVTMLLNFTFLMVVLYLKMDGLPLKYLVTGSLKIIASTVAMCAVVYYGKDMLLAYLHGSTIQQLLSLSGIIVSAALLYGILLNAMKLSELSNVVSKFIEKFRRKSKA